MRVRIWSGAENPHLYMFDDSNQVDEPSNNIIQSKQVVVYFKELLNRPAPLDSPNIEVVGPPTIEEISKAIRQIKSGKAAGPDNIPTETVKADVAVTPKMLNIVFCKIGDEEQVPTDWKESHLIKILKKGNETELTDCYTNKNMIYSVTQTEQECRPLSHYSMFSMRHVELTPLTGINLLSSTTLVHLRNSNSE
ncbi:unnamed protein product [Schistosoma mattheei]|uniref:Uncharacterized protein n=1 Tax=Schistosoma mattheei TaxID=31246 RepID=A0A183PAT4_9TREM|nr:unnamed protein product [Schistosoma mattheei]